MRRALIFAVMSLSLLSEAHAAKLKLGTWNIANLHHENNFALRDGAQARDQEDFDRTREPLPRGLISTSSLCRRSARRRRLRGSSRRKTTI